MALLIISDIHGCVDNLTEIFNTPHHYDEIVLLGDYLNHGPRNPILSDYDPLKVADLLNTLDSPIAVRGNCDSEVDQMLLNFDMFDDYQLLNRFGKTLFVTHGHIYDPNVDAEKLDHDIFISGHTHLPIIKKHDYGYELNPGSISMPKEDNPATYAIITDFDITIYTIDHKHFQSLSLK